MRQTRRSINIWSLSYGEEWRPILLGALDAFEQMQESHPAMFPKELLYNLWEELAWRAWEELREQRRALYRESGKDVLRKEEITELALLPDHTGATRLRLPSAFDLEDPSAWFRQSVLPRINRKQQRALWDLTWKGSRLASSKAGERPVDERQAGGTGGDAPDVPKSAYPSGKPLSPSEQRQASEHAPRDGSGKALCWGALTHQGCSKSASECSRSHAPTKLKMTDLHLDGPVEPRDIDGRVQQLRAQSKSEEDAKKNDKPDAARKSGSLDRAGIPEEYTWEAGWKPPFTAAEQPLRQALQGGAIEWLADHHPGGIEGAALQQGYGDGPSVPLITSLPESPSEHMECYLRTKATQSPESDLSTILAEAA
eukprot:5856329-Amphidinium_carterae.3